MGYLRAPMDVGHETLNVSSLTMASSFTGYADTFPVVRASVTHYDCRGRYLSNYQCCTSVLEWPRFVNYTIIASLVVSH